MKRTTIMLCAVAALALPAIALGQNTATPAANTALTLYNQGAAVVGQSRQAYLDAGRQVLSWPGMPQQIVADSLWLAGDGVILNAATVSGQPDTDPLGLLQQRIGLPVTLLPTDDDKEPRQATLVGISDTRAVVRIDDRLQLIDMDRGEWRIAWPAPQGRSSPTALQLTITAEQAGMQSLTLAYQRPAVNWHASYTGRYDAEQGTLKLQALAVISNASGSPIEAGQVALVAGDVARTSEPQPRPMMMVRAAVADMAMAAEKTAGGGYYRYELEGGINLDAGATQLLPLMQAQTLQVEQTYRIEGQWHRFGTAQRTHATIRLQFENSSGQPLPAGPVRIYGQAPAMLLGEDQIGNIPAGAPVTLTLGQAFDITAERHLLKASREDDTHSRMIEITVFNARDKAATATLVEHLPEGAEITSESIKHERKTARKAVWTVTVPAGGETALTYSIRWKQ